ncbi:MAG: hypothetical protein ACM3X7_02805 [Solirubrobacterales bacterium]
MNDNARDNMHLCKEALQNAQKFLKEAASQVENGNMRELITNQLKHVDSCAEECQKICSGLSQYKTHGMHY